MSGKDYLSEYLLESQSLNSSFNSGAILLARSLGFSASAISSGSPNGTWKLQYSNAIEWNAADIPAGSWLDFPDSAQAITNAGNTTWDVETKCKWVRIVWTFSSGTGSATITAFARIKH